MSDAVKDYTDFVLPPSLISRVDVSHMVTEAERVDNEMTTTSVRAKVGGDATIRPTMSEQLSEFLEKNPVELEDSKARGTLIKQLRLLKDKVPIIHMTFAVEADPESLQQLAAWVRTEIHPQAVIDARIQPALVAGVYLRTPNHVHDLSLRGKLKGSRAVLVKELEGLRSGR